MTRFLACITFLAVAAMATTTMAVPADIIDDVTSAADTVASAAEDAYSTVSSAAEDAYSTVSSEAQDAYSAAASTIGSVADDISAAPGQSAPGLAAASLVAVAVAGLGVNFA